MNNETQPTEGHVNFWARSIFALVLSVPGAFMWMLAGGFASDSGPNLFAYGMYYTGWALPFLVLVCAIISHRKQSRRWSNIALILPFSLWIFLFATAMIGNLVVLPIMSLLK